MKAGGFRVFETRTGGRLSANSLPVLRFGPSPKTGFRNSKMNGFSLTTKTVQLPYIRFVYILRVSTAVLSGSQSYYDAVLRAHFSKVMKAVETGGGRVRNYLKSGANS